MATHLYLHLSAEMGIRLDDYFIGFDFPSTLPSAARWLMEFQRQKKVFKSRMNVKGISIFLLIPWAHKTDGLVCLCVG